MSQLEQELAFNADESESVVSGRGGVCGIARAANLVKQRMRTHSFESVYKKRSKVAPNCAAEFVVDAVQGKCGLWGSWIVIG